MTFSKRYVKPAAALGALIAGRLDSSVLNGGSVPRVNHDGTIKNGQVQWMDGEVVKRRFRDASGVLPEFNL
jgi:hypothetical protein